MKCFTMNHRVFNVAVQSQSKRLRWGRIMRVCYLKTGAMTTEDHCRWGKFVVLFWERETDRKAEGGYVAMMCMTSIRGCGVEFRTSNANTQNACWTHKTRPDFNVAFTQCCMIWNIRTSSAVRVGSQTSDKKASGLEKNSCQVSGKSHGCQTNRWNSLVQ